MAFDPTRFYRIIKDAPTINDVYRLLEPYNLKSDQEHRIVNMFKTSQMVKKREMLTA